MKLNPKIALQSHPMVYEPSEDSYLLLRFVKVRKGEKVLELGTGSGLIALHCSKLANVTAADINPHAVKTVKENALLNDLSLECLRSDLFEGIKGKYDVIIFNPPYLEEDGEKIGFGEDEVGPGEERHGEKDGEDWLTRSWDGGLRGEETILGFLSAAKKHLRKKGRIYLLVSSRNEEALGYISENFKAKKLGERMLFFEVIMVYELTL